MGAVPSFNHSERHVCCAIYARVSTKKQADENASIDVQLHLARKYAAERGWTIYAEYADRGASGRSDNGRPQFNAMIKQALSERPPFTAILVYDHSRFFRNAGQSGTTREALRLNGVEVRSITQPVRDDGLTGSLAINIQAAVDENQSAITSLKVRDGMAAAAREGFYVGGTTPYGYRLKEAERRGKKIRNKLEIEPDEARVVEYIYDLYQQELGIATITAKLNGERIPTRSGKPWYKSAVGKILSSSTYAGRHQFRPTDWETKKTLPASEWIVIPCPPIVDEATFQRVQRLLRKRQPRMTPPRETTSGVLLAKIARCGSCAGAMQIYTGTGRNKTVYDYYSCARKASTGHCPGGNPARMSRSYLDEVVLQKLADELFVPARIEEIVSRAAQMQSSVREAASKRQVQLERQLAAARRKESNLWDLAADQGLKARAGFMAKLDAVQQEVAELEHLVSEQAQMIEQSVRRLSEAEASEATVKMRQLLLGADIKLKKSFVRAVLDKVIVGEDEIKIIGTEAAFANCANHVVDKSPPRFAVSTGSGSGGGT